MMMSPVSIQLQMIVCTTDPDMPADIKAVAAGPTSVLLAWRAPLHTNGILTKYTVRMQDLTDQRVSAIGVHCIVFFIIYFKYHCKLIVLLIVNCSRSLEEFLVAH